MNMEIMYLTRRFAAYPIAAAALLSGTPIIAATDPCIAGLRCEYRETPIGVDATKPRLSWKMEEPGSEGSNSKSQIPRGQRQTAYQVLVASTPDLLAKDQGDLWDSGKVASDQSIQVEYAGKSLESRTRCHWKVRVWDQDGKVLPFSAASFWEMGLLKPDDWRAKWIEFTTVPAEGNRAVNFADAQWIWFPEGNPAERAPAGERFFRHPVTLPAGARIKSARFILTVDDRFVVFVNGKEAAKSDGLKDAWRQAVTVDLKNMLAPGANIIAVAATNMEPTPAGFIGRLEIDLDGAAPLVLQTDRTWKVAEKASANWQTSAFDDRDWPVAREVGKYGTAPWGNFLNSSEPSVPCPALRKTFALGKPIKSARVYATALGLYELRLNGQRAGDHVMAPEWTDYRKRIRYQVYDVTALVKPGENAFAALLANGWYSGRIGNGGNRFYGQRPALLAQLEVTCADGSVERIVTDTSWQGHASPIMSSDFMLGEDYDAQQEIKGWDKPGLDDTAWQAVTARDEAPRPLEGQVVEPVRVVAELKAKSIKEQAPGRWVFDLGQNMVGVVRLKVSAPAGTKVTLRHAEILNQDGTLYVTNLRGAPSIDHYTCKGGGGETWQPKFTFHGFRYVEVSGLAGKLTADTVTGIVIASDTPPAGQFACSDPRVNQLKSNIQWGQRGNYLSVPTDCPQRDERLGWMGDAEVFVRTATCNADVAAFFTKWLVDVDDGQSPDGAYFDVSPATTGNHGTPAWADAGVICPWTIYLAYGDKRVLEHHLPGMIKWVEWCRAHSNNLIRDRDRGGDYGDWLSQGADTPKDLIGTAYFALSTSIVAKACKVLGKSGNAAKYEALFEEIKAAFNKKYVNSDGRITGNTQCVYAMALKFGLLPEALKPKAAQYLEDDIKAKGWHLSTGFVGVSYLLPVLTEAGKTDTAYKLLLQDTFPSWLFSVKHGATTIWERWDGWTPDRGFQDPGMNSFNHYSLGSCGEWLFNSLAGIAFDPERPGYKHIICKPHPGEGITWANASYDSIHGKIASSWKTEGDRFNWSVTIPANTSATIHVPAKHAAAVTESGKPTAQVEGVKFLRMENGTAVYAVGSGIYQFQSTLSAAIK
jgi:alpha-L-rhamnosidase